jgi:hypothetical protein
MLSGLLDIGAECVGIGALNGTESAARGAKLGIGLCVGIAKLGLGTFAAGAKLGIGLGPGTAKLGLGTFATGAKLGTGFLAGEARLWIASCVRGARLGIALGARAAAAGRIEFAARAGRGGLEWTTFAGDVSALGERAVSRVVELGFSSGRTLSGVGLVGAGLVET